MQAREGASSPYAVAVADWSLGLLSRVIVGSTLSDATGHRGTPIAVD